MTRFSSRAIFLMIATLVAWVLAFNSGRDLAYNLSYLLTVLLVLSYLWAWNSLRGLQLRRITRTRRSQVGQYAEEQFEVGSRSRWPKLWLEIRDESLLPWHDASRVVSGLTYKTTQRWQVRTLCTQRGRFRLGPLSIHSGDPLGIFQVEQHIETTSHIVVYPLAVDLSSFEPFVSDMSGGEARHRRTNQITTNVAGVRDYVHGDSLNRIHWPTSARTRRLMAKEFELDPTADVWLYLDLHRDAEASLPWTPTAPEPALFSAGAGRRKPGHFELPPITTEYGVTAAASLARYFVMRNRAVGFSSRGRTREFLQADRGERQLNKIMEALAVVTASGTLPFAQLIAVDGIRLSRNDTLLAISADPSPEWAMALHHIQRRGVNSIAVVIDGTTFGRPLGYDELYAELDGAGIPAYRICKDDPLDAALSQAARVGDLPMAFTKR